MTLEELKHNKDRITRVVLEEEEHGFKKVSERHLNNRDDWSNIHIQCYRQEKLKVVVQ